MARAELRVRPVWAGDRWTDQQVGIFETRLVPILDLAEIGLELAGLEVEGEIDAHLYRVYDAEAGVTPSGYCIDGSSYAVNVRRHHIRGPQRPSMYVQAALHAHEITHVERARRYLWDESLIEYAATEGLAYFVDTNFMQAMSNGRFVPIIVEWLQNHSDSNIARLRDVFLHAEDGMQRGVDVDLHEEWFGKGVYAGSALGLYAVSGLVADGAGLPEIMKMPASKILGVE